MNRFKSFFVFFPREYYRAENNPWVKALRPRSVLSGEGILWLSLLLWPAALMAAILFSDQRSRPDVMFFTVALCIVSLLPLPQIYGIILRRQISVLAAGPESPPPQEKIVKAGAWRWMMKYSVATAVIFALSLVICFFAAEVPDRRIAIVFLLLACGASAAFAIGQALRGSAFLSSAKSCPLRTKIILFVGLPFWAAGFFVVRAFILPFAVILFIENMTVNGVVGPWHAILLTAWLVIAETSLALFRYHNLRRLWLRPKARMTWLPICGQEQPWVEPDRIRSREAVER